MSRITVMPTEKAGSYQITLEGGQTYSIRFPGGINIAGNTNVMENITVNGTTISNENGQLVLTAGDLRLEGADAERAMGQLNDHSLQDIIFEQRRTAYNPDTNPFAVGDKPAAGNGLLLRSKNDESVRVDVANHDVQIIAKSDLGTWGDRDAAYRIRRQADGTLTETFMQYRGMNSDLSSKNFYEVTTAPDGTMTAKLHTWNTERGEYTSADCSLSAALGDRSRNLSAIGGDDSLGAYNNTFHGKPGQEGILRQAIGSLQQSGTSLDGAVFNGGESLPSQQPSRTGLQNVAADVRGRWF